MKLCKIKLHFVTYLTILLALATTSLPLSLAACVKFSTGKLNSKAVTRAPAQDPEFRKVLASLHQICGDFDTGLPFRIAFAPGFNQDVTLWWRRLSRDEVVLDETTRVEVETMGAEATLGIPASLDSWLQQALETKDRTATLKLKADLVAECMKIADTQTERVIDDALQFVLGIYARRYKLTPNEVSKIAGEYLFSVRTSTFFIVRDRASKAILGSIRAVRAPYGRRYVAKATGGHPLEDHSGSFGPVVAELLPHETPPRASNNKIPIADSKGYENHLESGPPRFGPASTFSYLFERSKTVEGGEFRPLPLELALKVKVPRDAPGTLNQDESNNDLRVYYGAGELIELSGLAIAKDAHPLVWNELFRRVAKKIENLTTTRHVTLWNRTVAPRIFEPLGFERAGDGFQHVGQKPFYVMRAEAATFVTRVQELIQTRITTQNKTVDSAPTVNELSGQLEKELASIQLRP